MVIAIGADGDGVLHWCSIGAITSITIGANGSPLEPFFVAIGTIFLSPLAPMARSPNRYDPFTLLCLWSESLKINP